MKLTQYDPWNIIKQINDLLGTSLRSDDVSSMTTSQWVPAVDIKEEKDLYLIQADLPGINKDAIQVFMDNGMLTLKGERKEEHKEENSEYSRIERTYGSFHRQFRLPDAADSENISATYNDGVLKVSVPKKEAAKPKRISIADEKSNANTLTTQNNELSTPTQQAAGYG